MPMATLNAREEHTSLARVSTRLTENKPNARVLAPCRNVLFLQTNRGAEGEK